MRGDLIEVKTRGEGLGPPFRVILLLGVNVARKIINIGLTLKIPGIDKHEAPKLVSER